MLLHPRFPWSASLTPIAALVVACSLWGGADAVTKVALDSFSPVQLTMLRFAVAACALWPLARRSNHPAVPMRTAIPLGLLGVTAVFLLLSLGIARTAASNASLMQGATPAVTAIAALAIARERVSLPRVVAIGCAVGGVLIFTITNGADGMRIDGGEILVLGSMIAFALFAVLGKSAMETHGAIKMAFAISVVGAASLFPFAVIDVARSGFGDVTPIGIAMAVLLGVGCSAVAYGLWGYALRRLDVCCVAAFDALIPLVGCLVAATFLGDAITGRHVLGGATVIVALGLMGFERKLTARPRPQSVMNVRPVSAIGPTG